MEREADAIVAALFAEREMENSKTMRLECSEHLSAIQQSCSNEQQQQEKASSEDLFEMLSDYAPVEPATAAAVASITIINDDDAAAVVLSSSSTVDFTAVTAGSSPPQMLVISTPPSVGSMLEIGSSTPPPRNCGIGRGKGASFEHWQRSAAAAATRNDESDEEGIVVGAEAPLEDFDDEIAAPDSVMAHVPEDSIDLQRILEETHYRMSTNQIDDIPAAMVSSQESDVNTQDEMGSSPQRSVYTNSGKRITHELAMQRITPVPPAMMARPRLKELRIEIADCASDDAAGSAGRRRRLSRHQRDERRSASAASKRSASSRSSSSSGNSSRSSSSSSNSSRSSSSSSSSAAEDAPPPPPLSPRVLGNRESAKQPSIEYLRKSAIMMRDVSAVGVLPSIKHAEIPARSRARFEKALAEDSVAKTVKLHDGKGRGVSIRDIEVVSGHAAQLKSLAEIAETGNAEGVLIKRMDFGRIMKFVCQNDPDFATRHENVSHDFNGTYWLAYGAVPPFMEDAALHVMRMALRTAERHGHEREFEQLCHFTDGELELWLFIYWELSHNDLALYADGEQRISLPAQQEVRVILANAINALPKGSHLRRRLTIAYNEEYERQRAATRNRQLPLSREFMLDMKSAYAEVLLLPLCREARLLWEAFMAKAQLHHYTCSHTNVAVHRAMVAHHQLIRGQEAFIRGTRPQLRNRNAHKIFPTAQAALELMPFFKQAKNIGPELLAELNHFCVSTARQVASHLICAGIFPDNTVIGANYMSGYVHKFAVELYAALSTPCTMGTIETAVQLRRFSSNLLAMLPTMHRGLCTTTRISQRAIRIYVDFLRDILHFQMRTVISGAGTFAELNEGMVHAFGAWSRAHHTIGEIDMWDCRDEELLNDGSDDSAAEFSEQECAECDGSDDGENVEEYYDDDDDDVEGLSRKALRKRAVARKRAASRIDKHEITLLLRDLEAPPIEPRGEIAAAIAESESPARRKATAPSPDESDGSEILSPAARNRRQTPGPSQAPSDDYESDGSEILSPAKRRKPPAAVARKRKAPAPGPSQAPPPDDYESDGSEILIKRPRPEVATAEPGPSRALDEETTVDEAEVETEEDAAAVIVRDYKSISEAKVKEAQKTLRQRRCGISTKCVLCRDRSSRIQYYLSPKHLIYACRWCIYIAVTDKRLSELCRRVDACMVAPLLSHKCGQAFISEPVARKNNISYNHADNAAGAAAPAAAKRQPKGKGKGKRKQPIVPNSREIINNDDDDSE